MSQTPLFLRHIAWIVGRPETERVPAIAGQIARFFRRRFQEAGSAPKLGIACAMERNPLAKVFANASVQA
jgi:hypothetical protein